MKKYKTLGRLLVDYRAYSKISQADLASEFDVDVRSVIRWEKNDTLLSAEKEKRMTEITFIPYQVIRNLNTPKQIPTFYDFDLRKYSPSAISSELPDAEWIKSRIDIPTNRIRTIETKKDIENIIRFTELQKNPLKNIDAALIREALKLLPELNIVILDQSGYYSGHCVYFPLSMETYQKIRARELTEVDLKPEHLVNYKHQDVPVFYCHSITADCNENFFYIIGAVLKFYRDEPLDDYLYALLTSRYDSFDMSKQLGVHIVWQDDALQEKEHMLAAPRLVEGNFSDFLK